MIRKLKEGMALVDRDTSPRHECPGCGSIACEDFHAVQGQPLFVGVLFDTLSEANQCERGDITLSYCHSCRLVHNRTLDASRLAFPPGYDIALNHSATFRAFMEGVATRLVDRYDLRNKTVFEIGCGTGYFLRLLCGQGNNDGIGVDPTIIDERTETCGDRTIQFIRDYFDERFVNKDCDFICCLSVFEAIPRPADLLSSVRKMAGGQRRLPVYFETFNAAQAIDKLETWSIHYEQCNYFRPDSFSDLFRRCGFEILDADTCYEGGQYIYVEAIPDTRSGAELPARPPAPSADLPPEIRRFSAHHQRSIATWNRRLRQFAQEGKKVVVWGSGGKGTSFLNVLSMADTIQYVVDINPKRQNKFIPGSGQKVVPPEFLTEYRPDIVVLTNCLYEREIKEQVDQLGLECEFLPA